MTSETVKDMPVKAYPNHCGAVIYGLSVEELRQIILEELEPETKDKLLRLFEYAVEGRTLVVVDGVEP